MECFHIEQAIPQLICQVPVQTTARGLA